HTPQDGSRTRCGTATTFQPEWLFAPAAGTLTCCWVAISTAKQGTHRVLWKLVAVSLLVSVPLRGQAGGGVTLSGTVTAPSGAVAPRAKVSVKQVASGRTAEAETDSAGFYIV